MEIAAAILSVIKSTNATMHTINVQYISHLCSMPLHQHCWNSCFFPLRYLWNQHFYIINVRRRHFESNTGCFCAIEMKEENTCAHTNNIGNNTITIRFSFYINAHTSEFLRQQLPSCCICSTRYLIRRPASISICSFRWCCSSSAQCAWFYWLENFSHENRGKYSHDSILQYTIHKIKLSNSISIMDEWMNELRWKSQQLYCHRFSFLHSLKFRIFLSSLVFRSA